jgi:hypothetical protein
MRALNLSMVQEALLALVVVAYDTREGSRPYEYHGYFFKKY